MNRRSVAKASGVSKQALSDLPAAAQSGCQSVTNDTYDNPSSRLPSELGERALLESFESYYLSEEDNIEGSGQAELSYLAYKHQHSKGSRRRRRSLLEHIVKLQIENSRLKQVIHNTRPRSRSKRRTSTRRSSIRHANPRQRSTRRQPCRACAGLCQHACSKHKPLVAFITQL